MEIKQVTIEQIKSALIEFRGEKYAASEIGRINLIMAFQPEIYYIGRENFLAPESTEQFDLSWLKRTFGENFENLNKGYESRQASLQSDLERYSDYSIPTEEEKELYREMLRQPNKTVEFKQLEDKIHKYTMFTLTSLELKKGKQIICKLSTNLKNL